MARHPAGHALRPGPSTGRPPWPTPPNPPAPAPRSRPRRRRGRLAVALPAAALLTLAGAGSALAAPPDPGGLTLAGTSGGSDLTSLFALSGGWPTLTDLTSATADIPGTGQTPTGTPGLPTSGTLLADNRIVDAARLGTCTIGPGDAYRLNAVTRYPLGIGPLKLPALWQTLNVEYCQASDGTVTVGQPAGNSGPTHTGRVLGIQKTVDDRIDVIPPVGAGGSWHLLQDSRFRSGTLVPGLGERFYNLRMDVRIPPQGSPICTASIDGDSTRTTCQNNGIKRWVPPSSDPKWDD